MITVVVTMLGDCYVSPLVSFSQVCLVQDTWQMTNFMCAHTQLRVDFTVTKSKRTNAMFFFLLKCIYLQQYV